MSSTTTNKQLREALAQRGAVTRWRIFFNDEGTTIFREGDAIVEEADVYRALAKVPRSALLVTIHHKRPSP